MALLLCGAACGDGSPTDLACPSGTAAYRAPAEPQLGGAVVFSEWCRTPAGVAHGPYRLVDESMNGTNGERGSVVPGPVVLVTGQFVDGLAEGAWKRWNKRYYAANFTLDLIVAESWDRGLADGTWQYYTGNEGDGSLSDSGTRTYRGGVACGTWTAPPGADAAVYLPCDEVGRLGEPTDPLPPEDSELGAPVTSDFGWDGRTCPDGSAPIPEPDDVRALACYRGGLREGPFGRWYGAPGAPLQRKRDDGQYLAGKRASTWRSWHSNAISSLWGDYGDDGERTGSWRQYYADGWLAERADFLAGLRDGAVASYHDGGHPATEEQWRAGFRQGPYASWLADGSEVYEGSYRHGLKHGDWTVWSDEQGSRARLLEHWDDGTPTGTWDGSYDSGGQRASTVTFIDGLAEGPTTQWWKSGGERLIGQLAAGQRWGIWRTFYEDGTHESEQVYVFDSLNGPARTWYPDGSPESEGAYDHDERAYTWTVWDSGGTAHTCAYPWPGDPACP